MRIKVRSDSILPCYKGKLGVGIISFNRPHYLSQMLQSLQLNDLWNADFHFYQDGHKSRLTGLNLTPEESIKDCLSLFNNTYLPNKEIHPREVNLGIGINQFLAYEELSSNYEYVLILEDDIVVSPHFIYLLRVLIKQFLHQPNIFSVSLNFKRRCLLEEILNNLQKVSYKREDWFAECFDSFKWKQRVKPLFMSYYNLIKDVEYKDRPHEKIRELYKQFEIEEKRTSQDGVKEVITKYLGLERISTVVNRGIYIGEEGTHSTKRLYEQMNFKNQEPFIFETDRNIKEFTC